MRRGLRWIIAAALLPITIGLTATCGGGEPARAATRAPTDDDRQAPNATSFLGALSFKSSREPIAVTADALEFDYRTRVLTYSGGVEVIQGDMRLESEKLTVTLDQKAENRIKEVVAEGKVRVSQGTRWATGGRAVFDQTEHTVVLSDNAELHDGPNHVSGNRVVVYLDQQRSVVEGGNGRVKAVLFPPKDDTMPLAERREP